MSNQLESIPMQPLSSALSSKWSLDTEDIKQATELPSPTPPPRAWFPPRRRKATTRYSYIIGDPVIHPTSETGYTFEEWIGRSKTNARGEVVREARFRRHPALFPPYDDILLPLYQTSGNTQHTADREPPFWTRQGKHIVGWLEYVRSLGLACMSRRHAL
jgi:hypothetical protein